PLAQRQQQERIGNGGAGGVDGHCVTVRPHQTTGPSFCAGSPPKSVVTAHRTRHTGRLAHRSALLVIPRRAVAEPQFPFPVGTAVDLNERRPWTPCAAMSSP